MYIYRNRSSLMGPSYSPSTSTDNNVFNDIFTPSLPSAGFVEDPFRSMNRVMNNMLAPLAVLGPSLLPSFRDIDAEGLRLLQRVGLVRNINLDILEKPDRYEIHCELPGVTKRSVKVEVDADKFLLMVSAEKKFSTPTGSADNKEMMKMDVSSSGSSSSTEPSGGSNPSTTSDSPDDDRTAPESKVRHTERIFGSVSRMISLPSDIDFEKVEAKLENGILSIVLMKRKETITTPKTVKIE